MNVGVTNLGVLVGVRVESDGVLVETADVRVGVGGEGDVGLSVLVGYLMGVLVKRQTGVSIVSSSSLSGGVDGSSPSAIDTGTMSNMIPSTIIIFFIGFHPLRLRVARNLCVKR